MNILSSKYSKGDYEYAKYHKNRVILFTIILFAVSISLYLLGYITTKSNKNYLTIVAILGLLPASKSLVSVIMNLKVKTSDITFKNKVDENINKLCGMYHILFTSYDANFYFSHLTITNNSLICFCDDPKVDEKKFKEHLEKHMKIEGIDNNIIIKVFKDEDSYIKRLIDLNKLEDSIEINQKLCNLIYSISL